MIYSKFIRDLGDKTGIPLRTIEAEWKIMERKLNFDILTDPPKYSRLKKMDGTIAEEIARRVEESLLTKENLSTEEEQILS